MRLLFLIDSLGSGGAQRQMVTIAPILKQQGINVEVLCYHRDSFFIEPLKNVDIKVHWVIAANPIIRIIRIRSFIRKGKYDAVISFLETPDFLNCVAAIGRHSWKVITSERSAKEETFHTRRGKLIGWLKRYSDAIVCNSENARQMWGKYHPQYKNKLKVIYNIVTLPKIDTMYIPRKDGKTHIVVAASYQYLKNPINVIEAVNQLDADKKKKLIIEWFGRKNATAGNTNAYDESTELVTKYNLNNVFLLNEATPDIGNRMNEADCVGLFSKMEGLPNAICEAMTLSKPIIMSKVSDYDVLVDEKNGFLCDWNNIESIKLALENILSLTDEQLIIAGENSRLKAKLLFGNKTIIENWRKVCCLK